MFTLDTGSDVRGHSLQHVGVAGGNNQLGGGDALEAGQDYIHTQALASSTLTRKHSDTLLSDRSPAHSSSLRGLLLTVQTSSSPSLPTHRHLLDEGSGWAGRKSPCSEHLEPFR